MDFPNDTQRLVIVGKTGTGKTQAAMWHLSRRSFDEIPWIIFDFKADAMIAESGAKEIELTGKAPRKPGLYVVRPLPDQQELVDELLWDIWRNEDTGVYIDEGYMIGNSSAFRALLTQGRSKNIPVIVLSQRPVWISRFVFSEADFYQVFWLNDFRDRKTVDAFIPFDLENRLPDYHSLWYDVASDTVCIFKPVPSRESILETFRDRIQVKRRLI